MYISHTTIYLTDGQDYDGVNVELMFNATVSRSCAEIPITEDPLLEPMEMFNVSITTGDPDVIPDPPTSIVTIIDNDSKLTMLACLAIADEI